MAGKRNTLSDEQVALIKGLLATGRFKNQEIAGMINRYRGSAESDVSTGRITNIKKGQIKKYQKIPRAGHEQVEQFLKRLDQIDPRTGLNIFRDERLIRAREAMILAVQLFNSPALLFKTEIFAVLSNIAWTYLLHEFFSRKGISIFDDDEKTITLSKMLEMPECPVSKGTKNNLSAIKEIRDEVEHRLFGMSDQNWSALYQACCLNFDKCLTEHFGEQYSLQTELSIALQFSKPAIDELGKQFDYDLPENIKALDRKLNSALSQDELDDLEYQFRVVYTMVSTSKSRAHTRFLNPESSEAKEIKNVLVKPIIADSQYPYLAKDAIELIGKKLGQKFSQNDFVRAYKDYKIRPPRKSDQPDNTNKDYCLYHPSFNHYTYSDACIDFLVKNLSNPDEMARIRKLRMR